MGESAGIQAIVVMSLCPLFARISSPPFAPEVLEHNYAQSHKIIGVVRELWRSSSPTPPFKPKPTSKLEPTPKLDRVDEGYEPMSNTWCLA